MYYQKIISGETIIEFHNNWLGEETVVINGQVVSKKSSVWGTHHIFTVIENSKKVTYVLTTKVNGNLQIFIDLKKDDEIVQENIPIMLGGAPKTPKNKAKKNGLNALQKFDLDDAIIDFEEALKIDKNDPEIYFHLACVYSIQENVLLGFENLKKAVENKLHDTDMIFKHEMLSFLRIHEGFEDFANSDFTKYDEELLRNE